VPAAIAWLLGTVILLGPPLSVVGILLGARWLRKRDAPRLVVSVAYVLAALVGLVIVAGYVGAVVVAVHPVGDEPVEPSQKARVLAEGISEAMNCGAFALLVVLIAAGWIGFWRWRRRAVR
jgi:hypothetical protein